MTGLADFHANEGRNGPFAAVQQMLSLIDIPNIR